MWNIKRLCQSDHIDFHEYIFRQPGDLDGWSGAGGAAVK